MGNTPSKGPSADPSSTQAASSDFAVPAGDRRNNAIPGTAKATAVDPSASKEHATGVPASNNQMFSVKHSLHSSNASDPSPQIRNRQDVENKAPTLDQSDPVQVPYSRTRRESYPSMSSGPPLNTYYGASTHLQRPPRLPLPIGDATTTPGSPIIGPADSHVDDIPDDRALDEHVDQDVANVHSVAADEDESMTGIHPYAYGKAVPTTIDWAGEGNKVYVTGTFVNWEKKFRLHKKYVLFSTWFRLLDFVNCANSV